jgi:hypothetical protein
LISCLAFSPALRAETDQEPLILEKDITFRGFGTVGLVHAQANGATFIRDITEPKGATNQGLSWQTDTRVGFQVNLKISDTLEGVAQAVSHYQWDNNFHPELTWAFLKYSPDDMFDVRAGRIGFDALLAADTRDVGFTYLWARPPVEYYGTLPVPYIDGADIVLRHQLGSGVGRLKLFSGITRQKIPTFFGLTEDLSGSRITGAFADYQDNHWTGRIGKADIRLAQGFPGEVDIVSELHDQATQAGEGTPLQQALNSYAKDVSLLGKHISFSSIGLAYEDGPLQTQMALLHFTSQTLLYPEAHSGYISAGYRIDKLTPYVTISAVKSRKSSRADDLLNKGADPSLYDLANFMLTTGQEIQHTISLGMRYDMLPNVALKFQMDVIRNQNCSPVTNPGAGPAGSSCSAPLLWPLVPGSKDLPGNTLVPGTWDGKANIYSAVLDFTF